MGLVDVVVEAANVVLGPKVGTSVVVAEDDVMCGDSLVTATVVSSGELELPIDIVGI
jgi:hypothetical protein